MNPVPGFHVTTSYLKRGPQWSCNRNYAGEGVHTGYDFAAPYGTKVVAARPGQARYVNNGEAFGYHQLLIMTADGTSDFYAHMQRRTVADGQVVKAGQQIGEVGSSGTNSSGPHLHFERRKQGLLWSCTNHEHPQPSVDWEEPVPDQILKWGFIGMQWQDGPKQVKHDLGVVFREFEDRGLLWLGGSEAGGKKSNVPDILPEAAEDFGLELYMPSGTDSWMVWDPKQVKGYIDFRKMHVLDGQKGVHTAKAVLSGTATVQLGNGQLERFSGITAHYLPRHVSGSSAKNRQIAEAIGKRARVLGRGRYLATYAGDQNIDDRRHDTFRGQPLTTLQDEKDKYEPTKDGSNRTIDVLATYDGDLRVEARAVWVPKLKLHTDHKLVLGSVNLKV